VPVSAIPAKAGVSEAWSRPSLAPWVISSIGRPTGGGAFQGRPVDRRVGRQPQRRRQVLAGEIGGDGARHVLGGLATLTTVQEASRAISTKSSMRPRRSSWPRFGIRFGCG
jgi:hypothetical protein